MAGYPEKHLLAESMEADIINLKRKVDAGANVSITQLFYRNESFFRDRNLVRETGITIPIVPGLMPIQSASQIQRITSMCGASIPVDLASQLNDAIDDDDRAVKIGDERCISQATELLERGVDGIHFYVLNKSHQTSRIMKALPL